MNGPDANHPWYGKRSPEKLVVIVDGCADQRDLTDIAIREGEPVVNYGHGWETDHSGERK